MKNNLLFNIEIFAMFFSLILRRNKKQKIFVQFVINSTLAALTCLPYSYIEKFTSKATVNHNRLHVL